MGELNQIRDGLMEVFDHRSSFIVIGLTGRTGSGCSTVADTLCSSNLDEVELPELRNPPASHEDRKDRIVRTWLQNYWKPFKKIQVSHVIQLLALQNTNRFMEIVETSIHEPENIARIRTLATAQQSASDKALSTLTGLRKAGDDEVITAYNFVFEDLPNLSKKIKDEINNAKAGLFTEIFQALGDNVRKSGSPLSNEIITENLLSLPSFIARIIKLARLRNRIVGEENNYFVIDALRHPFEIRYLRERISPFYAVAITTSDHDRKLRLHALNYSNPEITRLDEKEYPSEVKEKKKRLTGYAALVSQDIQACLAIADIYVSNLGVPDSINKSETNRQITRYVALMQRPGMVTPTSIERCMHSAFSAKLNSGCISRQVGAVITDANYSIKAVGWNDAPRGQVPCLLRNTYFAITRGLDAQAYSKYERDQEFNKELGKTSLGKLKASHFGGRNIPYCFKSIYNEIKGDRNQVHTRALHAEENAFLQIVKYGGQGIEGGCLFTTASPCELCAKKAYQLGIKKIYYIDPYPGISESHILSVGEAPPETYLFSGAIGRAYHCLYEPIMPYKDELEKLVV